MLSPVPGGSFSVQQYSGAVMKNTDMLPHCLMPFPAEAPINQCQRSGILLASADLAPDHNTSSSPGKSSSACIWSCVRGLHQLVQGDPCVTSQGSDTNVTRSWGKEGRMLSHFYACFHFQDLDLRTTLNKLAEAHQKHF